MSIISAKKSVSVEAPAPSMVDQLKKQLDQVNSVRSEMYMSSSKASNMVDEWKKRVKASEQMMAMAVNSKAYKNAETLHRQARLFFDSATTQHEALVARKITLDEHMVKLQDAISSIKLTEQRSKLEGSLRRIAAKEGIDIESVETQYDDREIKRLIHSAQALVELKGE